MPPEISKLLVAPPAFEQALRVAPPVLPAAEERSTPPQKPPPLADLEVAVAALQKYFERVQAQLQFRTDDQSGRLVVSVVDTRDGTLLRQWPSEVVLRIAQHLDEYQAHLIQETV